MRLIRATLFLAGVAAIGVVAYIGKDYAEQFDFDDSLVGDSSKSRSLG